MEIKVLIPHKSGKTWIILHLCFTVALTHGVTVRPSQELTQNSGIETLFLYSCSVLKV